jgi:hypothetical protein
MASTAIEDHEEQSALAIVATLFSVVVLVRQGRNCLESYS